MADMKFLDTLEEVLLERGFPLNIVQKALETAQTIGAVEVVRCRDCKHRYSDSWCEYVDDDDNFYCARGERKGGGGNG